MAEKLRYTGKILGATVSREARWWSVSVTVEMPDKDNKTLPMPKPGACGIDVGLLRLATLSDGTLFENVRPLRKVLDKLARLQRLLARKQVGSRNREKLKARIARLHKRIRDVRNDILHKLTTWVAERYGFVAVEDLHVKGLTQNHCLARALADAALGRLLDLLETKVTSANGVLVKVDRFFPSSKRCANCGQECEDLSLADRVFVCPQCGFTADRDHNAAMNLLKEGLRIASRSAAGSGYDGVTPPQTGNNLDKRSERHVTLATSDHVCGSER
jgi:putative transposase